MITLLSIIVEYRFNDNELSSLLEQLWPELTSVCAKNNFTGIKNQIFKAIDTDINMGQVASDSVDNVLNYQIVLTYIHNMNNKIL